MYTEDIENVKLTYDKLYQSQLGQYPHQTVYGSKAAVGIANALPRRLRRLGGVHSPPKACGAQRRHY